MKVKNVSGVDRQLPATGDVVPDGGTIEVSKELGESLCEQPANWTEATSSKKTTKGDD